MSAALVLGGVDFRGPHLFTVYPHGSTDALPYATMGSGSLNAMAVFEDEYKCARRSRAVVCNCTNIWASILSCKWRSRPVHLQPVGRCQPDA